ncbi:hypothetical protein [Oryzihumus leptocrescens]|uniref:Uncharacterized protein n=1 Tax=Oryzihumus leptocrescens TaxID=297536 RepID=A0A542ZEX6_9MICO|nr:hypothetical protein [Oryzihumus leptocrescens]TQL58820.1 hypothetical protein FB474_0159 [Oryzihumus leptocrescens]
MGAEGTRTARGTTAGTQAGRGAGFRLRFGAAVGALALLSTGAILAVGGGRPDSAISLSRGQLTLALGGIFLAGVLSAALLAWALGGHRHATRQPGAELQPHPARVRRAKLAERRTARATPTRGRASRRAVAAPAPGTRAALRSTRRRRATR